MAKTFRRLCTRIRISDNLSTVFTNKPFKYFQDVGTRFVQKQESCDVKRGAVFKYTRKQRRAKHRHRDLDCFTAIEDQARQRNEDAWLCMKPRILKDCRN